MALKLGWVPNDTRESYWRDDPAVDWDTMTTEQRADYLSDGDRSNCIIRDGETPSLITYRALTADELATIRGMCMSHADRVIGESQAVFEAKLREGLDEQRMLLLCFRVGCDFPGIDVAAKIRTRGLSMLPNDPPDKTHGGFVDSITRRYPGIAAFYGGLVLCASTLTDDEKKSDSHPDPDGGHGIARRDRRGDGSV